VRLALDTVFRRSSTSSSTVGYSSSFLSAPTSQTIAHTPRCRKHTNGGFDFLHELHIVLRDQGDGLANTAWGGCAMVTYTGQSAEKTGDAPARAVRPTRCT
jgi:hypothetical protein